VNAIIKFFQQLLKALGLMNDNQSIDNKKEIDMSHTVDGNQSSQSCKKQSEALKEKNANKPQKLVPPLELHSCMGLNSCKGRDYFGTNECAGMGYCATVQHPCHTLNECAGQGGCGLFGTPEEFCHPGANDCAYQGSCGTPIPASRFITGGPNRGRSVWMLARRLFEERMDKRNRSYGPAPFQTGPTLEWLGDNVNWTSSCGQSGAKFCSFVSEDARQERRAKFIRTNQNELDSTCENCDC
jgi:hypothetical protein